MAFLQRHVVLYVPVVEILWDLVMKNEKEFVASHLILVLIFVLIPFSSNK